MIHDVITFTLDAIRKAEFEEQPEERRALSDMMDRLLRLDPEVLPEHQRAVAVANSALILHARDKFRKSQRWPGSSSVAL